MHLAGYDSRNECILARFDALHIYSSATQSATEFTIYRRQIMRKKTDLPSTTVSSTAVVSNKVISKPSRSKSTTATLSAKKKSTQLHSDKQVEKGTTFDLAGDVAVGDTHCNNEDISAGSSRDRSPTPLESDLLRYLTAHITPMHKQEHSEFYVDVTSFVIGREEYLQGIVRLVQSDCPEVSGDLKCFVQAMQQAFCVVSECDKCTRGIPETNI